MDNPDFVGHPDQRDAYLRVLRQTEQQSLEQLYGVGTKCKTATVVTTPALSSPKLSEFMKDLDARRNDFQDSGDAVEALALQEVEQERELSYEVEAVREVAKSIHYSALSSSAIHEDIATFAKTGKLVAGSNGYEHVYMFLRETALGQKHGIRIQATASKLYLSTEFRKTVKLPPNHSCNNFQVSHSSYLIA